MPDTPLSLQVQIAIFARQLEDVEKRSIERFAAADRAISKAEIATEKRFDAVNEFRATLSDQNNTFLRIAEFNMAHSALVDKVDVLNNQVIAIDTMVRSKFAAVLSGPSFMISAASVVVAIIIAIITGAIQLGSVQTYVNIDTANIERMQEVERARVVEHANENVERGKLETYQQIFEQRIARLESDIRFAIKRKVDDISRSDPKLP